MLGEMIAGYILKYEIWKNSDNSLNDKEQLKNID